MHALISAEVMGRNRPAYAVMVVSVANSPGALSAHAETVTATGSAFFTSTQVCGTANPRELTGQTLPPSGTRSFWLVALGEIGTVTVTVADATDGTMTDAGAVGPGWQAPDAVHVQLAPHASG